MNSLRKFIENKTSSRLNSTFIIYNDNSISYIEFEKSVINLSSFLEYKGICKGDNVAIISENTPDFILLIFSLWRLKAVPVPINTKLLPDEINAQINFADCKYALVHESIHDKLKELNISRLIFPIHLETEPSEIFFHNSFDKNETALMLFTSGSSGKVKAVMLSFENLIQSNQIGNQILKQNNYDRWLASLPFYHIGGFSIIVRTFLSGASIIIPDSLKNKDIIQALKKYKPTLASFVSVQLQRLIENNSKPNKDLRNVLIGGGFTSNELSTTAINKGWNITKVYGSTEVSSFVSAITSDEILKRPGSSGKALHPNEILIVNEKKKNVHANISGEIIIKSPSVTKGYYKNPEETRQKIRNNLYYTGDIGFLDEDGYLFVEARREDLIISGGENIIPKEVESAILKHPCIDEAFVFGFENHDWGQEVAAAVTKKQNKEIQSDELKNFLKSKLAGYKIPRRIFFINEIPKTALGKVQKDRLLNMILTNS